MPHVYLEEVLLTSLMLFCRVKEGTKSEQKVLHVLTVAFSRDLQCVKQQFQCLFLVQTSL